MKAFVPALAALLIATPALAGQAVSLRSDTTDADGRITLGELFDGAGAASDVIVASRVGPSAVLDAGAVQIAARRAGLDWANSNGVRRIIVRQGSDGAQAGASRGNVEVLAYARSLATGELVQSSPARRAAICTAPASSTAEGPTRVATTTSEAAPAPSNLSLIHI